MNKIFKILSYVLLTILGVLSLWLIVRLLFMNTLPIKYLGFVIVLILFIFFACGSVILKDKKSYRNLGIVIVLVFSLVIGYGITVIEKADSTLNNITNSWLKKKVKYNVLVFDDGEDVDDISLIEGKEVYILEVGSNVNNHRVVNDIRKELDSDIDVDPIKSIDSATKMIENNEVGALIMDNSATDLFEIKLKDMSRLVKTYEYEIEESNVRNEAKVTKEPFLIYISGIDVFGPLDYVSRSDVNKIMAVNPLSKDILLIDIPRDYYVPQPCKYNAYDKLTHSGMDGIACTIETVNSFFNIELNYYLRVNFTSLVDIVDALGGIEVNSDFTFDTHKAAAGYHFEKGINHLDGMEALMFSRERYAFEDGDTQRVKNQTKVLKAIIDKATSPEIITHYNDFMDVMANNIETNMNSDEIYSLIQMQLSDMAGWNIESITLEGIDGYFPSAAMGIDLYCVEPVMESVNNALEMLDKVMKEEY